MILYIVAYTLLLYTVAEQVANGQEVLIFYTTDELTNNKTNN